MRRLLVLIAVVFLASSCLAAEWSAELRVKSGDKDIDLSLRGINDRARTPEGVREVKIEMGQRLALSEREIQFLGQKGYTLSEIYYLASLARASGKPIDSVVALHSKGVGWGVLAHRLGVQPSALRKFVVAEKKESKGMMKESGGAGKEQKMEKEKVKIWKTGPMQPERSPGMGQGHGRKK